MGAYKDRWGGGLRRKGAVRGVGLAGGVGIGVGGLVWGCACGVGIGASGKWMGSVQA